ncbi:unnamed protein product [Prorocentrum cordatum]|uniref:PRA1 family protein n=1 Tax=Prorocentrum cordatum TaxID=2364126 RepID=A0ABN9U3D7_9DINO|nr:unnamed protein product [Polarella glacialis]
MAPRSETPSAGGRAEQMRERLAKKAAERTQGSPVIVSSLPDPRAVVVAGGKSMEWVLWALSALLLLVGLLYSPAPLVLCSVAHTAWFANFSRSDLAFQLRALHSVAAGLGMVPALRLPVYAALLANVAAYLALGFDLLERLLYCIPANRPENPEPLSFDFLQRLLTEPPPTKGKPFSVRAAKGGPGVGSDGFEYGTSRAERRKVR